MGNEVGVGEGRLSRDIRVGSDVKKAREDKGTSETGPVSSGQSLQRFQVEPNAGGGGWATPPCMGWGDFFCRQCQVLKSL